jgi:hypothetical protein
MKLSARFGEPTAEKLEYPLGDRPHDTLHHAVFGGCWDGHILDVPVESLDSLSHTLPVLEVN